VTTDQNYILNSLYFIKKQLYCILRVVGHKWSFTWWGIEQPVKQIFPYLPTLPFCADILTRNDPHSYFSGFFITVNRSKQTMGDHLKTLASSFHVRFISNRKSFLPCQLQQERSLCLDQAAVGKRRNITVNFKQIGWRVFNFYDQVHSAMNLHFAHYVQSTFQMLELFGRKCVI
jgi:hypothetical protein